MHVLGDLKAEAADRLGIIFRDAEARRARVAEREVWAKCGPPKKLTAKKVSKIARFVVAPTGIEPVYRGPGRSRRIPESPFPYGSSRF